MDLMGQLGRMQKEEVIQFVQQCQHECGGFGASVGHDPHLLYTLSAVQVNWKSMFVWWCLRPLSTIF